MTMNNADLNSVHMHYSPTAKYSIGYKGEYWREDEWQFHGVQGNVLLKRWNQKASQANIYLKNAVGLAYSDDEGFDHKTELAGSAGISMDWEDRRYFISYENRFTHAGDIDQFFMQKSRIGIAPYIGDYGDLHTWLMLEASHTPKAEDPVEITPLLRFFKNEYLWEVGANQNGDVLLNFVARY